VTATALWLLLGMSFLLATAALAQSGPTGSLSGTVSDPTDAVVPNAAVTLTNAATGAIRNTTTNAEGFWKVSFNGTGQHRLRPDGKEHHRPAASAGLNQRRSHQRKSFRGVRPIEPRHHRLDPELRRDRRRRRQTAECQKPCDRRLLYPRPASGRLDDRKRRECRRKRGRQSIHSSGAGGTYQIRDGTLVTKGADGTPNPIDPQTGWPTLGNIAETFEFRAIDRNLKTPYIQQWNLGVQSEINRDFLVEAHYLGTRGVKLLQATSFAQGYDLNDSNAPDFIFERFNHERRPDAMARLVDAMGTAGASQSQSP
jgi:hypothetical protein